MSSTEDAERIAAAALLNAKASMDRINGLLAREAEPPPAAASTGPPPGLSPEQEVQWWNDKISTLSSDSDKKSAVVSASQCGNSDKSSRKDVAGEKDSSRMTPRGMTVSEEAEWMDQRMARLAVRSESKGGDHKDHK